jgi:hypothetical protein
VDAGALVGVVDVAKLVVHGDRFDLADAAEGAEPPHEGGADSAGPSSCSRYCHR